MEKILYGARNMYEDSIILTEDSSIFSIKPEPLADYFRLNALGNSKLQNALWNLIPYIPIRITYNIRITTDIDDLGTLRKELLFKAWDSLNDKKGGSPEFINAIAYFTGNIRYYLGPTLLNYRKPNIDNWLECYYDFYDRSNSEQLFNYLSVKLSRICIPSLLLDFHKLIYQYQNSLRTKKWRRSLVNSVLTSLPIRSTEWKMVYLYLW